MRWMVALALGLGACTAGPPGGTTDAAATADAPPPTTSKTYHGMLDTTATVPFGGVVYCAYSITLHQLDVEIAMRPSGEVTGASVQALNVEAIVGSCPYQPAAPSIAKYTLESAKLTPTGSMLEFSGDPANAPVVALAIETSPLGANEQAMLSFQRTDQTGELAWDVKATVALTAP